MSTIYSNWTVNGVYTNATSAKLSNSGGTYGVRISPAGSILVADNTSMLSSGTGQYYYTFSDPSSNLTYDYVVEIVHEGETYWFPGTLRGPASISSPDPNLSTTRAEIERWLSLQGVDLRIDDLDADETSQDTLFEEIIADANEIVLQYLLDRYDLESLTVSNWVRRRATFIAAHLLCLRRGNPSPFTARYEQIINELLMVHNYALNIPNVSIREPGGAVLSNYTIDNRGLAPVTRVSPYHSVGTYPGQRTLHLTPYDG